MNVKTYQSKSLQEALNHIKRDLGSDALILSTREVRPARFLRKPRWEVAATAPSTRTVPMAATAAATAAAAGVPAIARPKARLESQNARTNPLTILTPPQNPAPKAEPMNLEEDLVKDKARRVGLPDRRIDMLLEDMHDLKRSIRSLGKAIPSRQIRLTSRTQVISISRLRPISMPALPSPALRLILMAKPVRIASHRTSARTK